MDSKDFTSGEALDIYLILVTGLQFSRSNKNATKSIFTGKKKRL